MLQRDSCACCVYVRERWDVCICVREYLEDALVPYQVAIILLTGGTKPGDVSSLWFTVLAFAPFPLLIFVGKCVSGEQ